MRKRHPVLFGLLLLLVIGAGFFLLVYSMSSMTGEKASFIAKERIGVVPLKGVITDAKPVVDVLEKFSKDDSIKAIVLRIDTPGGGVGPSQEIFEKVRSVRKKKTVVASMGSMATSGGYYVACAAEKIVANPGSLTGSIGVIMHFTNMEDLFKKVGLRASVIKSGRYKDAGSPFRDMTKEERELLQALIDDVHEQFVEAVSESRGLDKGRVIEVADGRVFTGRQALKFKLIDELGDLDHAAEVAARLAQLDGKPELFFPKEEKRSVWRYVMEEMVSVLKREMADTVAETGPGLSFVYLGQGR
ncbi:MAG TPA: signal peptide peptidase SppA [Syntrophales bacterium]|nr:signal peptide peptidase SppA [Syntrophobacterales bacterium]HNQ01936.1 signal peptide peptidase SppA [Syntrophales bacterium]HQL89751.1 signal peptide peptidase SppA [Syntrophales bacterium]